MGMTVVCESSVLLLQREDQPAALAALKEFLRECPGDFRLNGELAADDLLAALAIGGWHTQVDEHGDLVALSYAGDTCPPHATDDFPMSFFRVIAPFVRYGEFFRWNEGSSAIMAHSLGRGKSSYRRRMPGARLVQLGEPPLVRPGETAVVEFRVCGYGDGNGVVELECPHSTQLDHEFEAPKVAIDGVGRARLTPYQGAADPAIFVVSPRYEGVDQFEQNLVLRVATPPEQQDALHAVIAEDSPLNSGSRRAIVAAGDLPFALEALRRYAVRYSDRPGAEFLRGVHAAPDIASALRSAQLESAFSHDGALEGVRFTGSKLPGYERYLWGLFASLRGIVQADTWFSLAYAHDPRRWVRFSYDWRVPSRDLWER